ncbi:MAG: E3 ubiquitin-protein ligase SlrP [Chlamydiales bacterium]|nr:E3 ubiquitin-protein ligase SlrP [Chlamydiales bacterium]MCH9620214.1 E3 ubiquitin-protein ligase SlrP [Chlamydiales bacterium]MCH9623071.1 E3 ubiquitin-protein ligase SlrP [Chlamydiales bacterium]
MLKYYAFNARFIYNTLMNPIQYGLPSTTQLPYLRACERLRAKNAATHIPLEEFEELIRFLQTYSPEMSSAIEEGLLLRQTSLNLSNKGLTTLPNTIGKLINLTELYLHNNDLSDLPDAIGNLTNLTELFVNGNKLRELPDAIGDLTNLTTLSAENNQLRDLPEAIGRLINLTHLIVHHNQLETLPAEMGALEQLKKLYVNANNLSTLPNMIGHLRSLTHLFVDHNQLIALPDVVGNLAELREFSVSNNKLTTLPDALGRLTQLIELDLHVNCLEMIPPSIGDLSQLTTFTVAGNPKLSSYPISLGNCAQLRQLQIRETAISPLNRDQILEACKRIRSLGDFNKLPSKIQLWKGLANTVEEWPDPPLTEGQKSSFYRWISRLEKVRDFQFDQENLAIRVCPILETIYKDAEFRKIFFDFIAADLTECGDRAAMSLNLVYTEWRLHTLPPDTTLLERVELLVSCARTLKLRGAVLNRYPGFEDVEKVLYAEGKLEKRLKLATVSTGMCYRKIGKISNDELEEIAKEIEAIPRAELLIELGCWERYLKEHYTSEFFKIISGIQAAQESLLKMLDEGSLQSGEYFTRNKRLETQKEEAVTKLTKQIINGLLKRLEEDSFQEEGGHDLREKRLEALEEESATTLTK